MSDSKWPDAVVRFVKDNAHLLNDQEIAETLTRLLGVPYSATQVKKLRVRTLGIQKLPGAPRKDPTPRPRKEA